MRVEQEFVVARPPEAVFDYMTDPANLAEWQTTKLAVEPLTEGPPRQGYRVKERTRIGPRTWDQVVEFTAFERGRLLVTHIVEGAVPVDGRWTFTADGAGGTCVRFEAWGELSGVSRLFEPVLRRGIAHSFRRYHERLRRNVEALPG